MLDSWDLAPTNNFDLPVDGLLKLFCTRRRSEGDQQLADKDRNLVLLEVLAW
jgi:hypothetical protein